VGVIIQPLNQGRVATDAKVRDRGRKFFLSHAVPPETGYIIFIKYVFLEKGLSKKLKKKRIITQQYFSFHLINKYNRYIDNIFIGDFKSVFMAKAKSQVPLILRDEFTSTTSEQSAGEYKTMDISAYVDPLNGKVLKIVGVKFVIDNGTGLPLDDSDVLSYEPVVQLITGAQTAVKAASDIRTVAMTQFYLGRQTNQTAASTWTDQGLRYTTDVMGPPTGGYFVASDTLTLIQQSQGNAITSVRFMVVIEAQRWKLSANDVNFLLVNQVFTG